MGEPRTFDLVVNETIRIYGALLFDDTWTVSLQSLNGEIIVDGDLVVPHGEKLTLPPRIILPSVPEPSTWLMLLTGLGLVYRLRWHDLKRSGSST